MNQQFTPEEIAALKAKAEARRATKELPFESHAGDTGKFRIPDPSEPGAERIAGERLIALGYPAIAVVGVQTNHPNRGKAGRGEGWNRVTDYAAAMQERLVPGDSIGILGGQVVAASWHPAHGVLRLIGIDVDFPQEAEANTAREGAPDSPIRTGQPPKWLTWALVPYDQHWSTDHVWVRKTDAGEEQITLQIIGASRAGLGPRHATAFGMHPKYGMPYSWAPNSRGEAIFDFRAADLPVIDLDAELARIDAKLAPLGWVRRPKTKKSRGRMARPDDVLGKLNPAEAAHMTAWARGQLSNLQRQLDGRVEKTGRGYDTFLSTLKFAPCVGAGLITVEEISAAIDAVNVWSDVEDDCLHALESDVDMDVNWAVIELARYRKTNGFSKPERDTPEARLQRMCANEGHSAVASIFDDSDESDGGNDDQ